jgi:hypothetical protein
LAIERITLVLNTDDPEQKQLYRFVKLLPNGSKRNASAFLRTLVDREYQKQSRNTVRRGDDGVIRLKF